MDDSNLPVISGPKANVMFGLDDDDPTVMIIGLADPTEPLPDTMPVLAINDWDHMRAFFAACVASATSLWRSEPPSDLAAIGAEVQGLRDMRQNNNTH